jgi:hypothetical protein
MLTENFRKDDTFINFTIIHLAMESKRISLSIMPCFPSLNAGRWKGKEGLAQTPDVKKPKSGFLPDWFILK